MGKRGPKPEPTPLKLLKGNPGKRPINGREPKPKKTKSLCPGDMPVDGRREWDRIYPELDRLGLLTTLDLSGVEGLCRAYARSRQAERELADVPLTVTTDKGYVMAHPLLAVAKTWWAEYRRWCAEYGLTPSARTGLHAGGSDGDDGWDEFIA